MINKNMMFKVGDKIINFNKVYRIFKIVKSQEKGKKERTLFFRPFFPTKEERPLIFSLPVNCIERTNIRRPISKKEVRLFLKELAKRTTDKIPLDLNKTKIELSLNDLNTQIKIIRNLWKEKNYDKVNFTKSKSDLLGLIIKSLIEEFALVTNVSLVKAEEKIKAALKRSENC